MNTVVFFFFSSPPFSGSSSNYGIGQNELRAVLKDGDTLWLSSRTELIKFNVTTGKWQLFPSLLGDNQLLFLENVILKVGNILYLGSTRGLEKPPGIRTQQSYTNADVLNDYSILKANLIESRKVFE